MACCPMVVELGVTVKLAALSHGRVGHSRLCAARPNGPVWPDAHRALGGDVQMRVIE